MVDHFPPPTAFSCGGQSLVVARDLEHRAGPTRALSIVITRPKFSAFLKIRRRLARYKPLLALRNSFGILGQILPKESERITQSKKGFVPELE